MKNRFRLLQIELPLHRFFYSVVLISVLLNLICTGKSRDSDKRRHTYSTSKDTIVLLSYNVENLFDLVDNGTEYTEYVPYKRNWNNETYSKKLKNLASAIAASDADILVLCEIENRHAGMELKKALLREGQRYRYIAAGVEPNPATTCQVILSRFPIVSTEGYGIPKTGSYFTRNILEADIDLGSCILKIFALHLPSKRYPESERIRAAQILYKRLKNLPDGTEYVIAGDFNSNYNEAETFFTERLDDTKGMTAINHLLKTVRSKPGLFLDYITEHELIGCSKKLLHYDLWLELHENQRCNYKYRGRCNTLDHILVPASMYDSIGISYIDNSFSLFTWDGRLLFNGVPYRWKMRHGKNGRYHIGEGFSDHLPIIAKFTKRPFSFSKEAITVSDRRKEQSEGMENICGFESGFEGWIPCSENIHISRDTLNVSGERYSLKIEGRTKKSGGAARIRIPLSRYSKRNIGAYSSLSLDLRGSGKFTFRIRSGKGKWRCYIGRNFSKIIRSTRYSFYTFNDWHTVFLPLPETEKDTDALELEIRTAGKNVINLFIDNVRFVE